VASRAPARLLHPAAPQPRPGRPHRPPRIASLHIIGEGGLKKTAFMFYKGERAKQEMKEPRPGRQTKKGGRKKSTAERGESTFHHPELRGRGEEEQEEEQEEEERHISGACVCNIAAGVECERSCCCFFGLANSVYL